MKNSEKLVRDKIIEFVEYSSLITTRDADSFEPEYRDRLNQINEISYNCMESRKLLMQFCYQSTTEHLDTSRLCWQSRHKPHGYPGDFLIIDWLYTRKIRSEGVGALWDDMFLRQEATKSVFYRKEYFFDKFKRLYNEKSSFSILNIASGPGRDIENALSLTNIQPDRIMITNIDMDENAIKYAKKLTLKHDSSVNLQWQVANIFRCKFNHRYDLIWVGGLFDYLENRLAVALLKRIWKWASEDGKIIIGNFHPKSPSRNMMEWCLDWFLLYRTEEQVIKLYQEAGIPTDSIQIEKDPYDTCYYYAINRGK